MSLARITFSDTSWKIVRWVAGTSGRARPVLKIGISPLEMSSLSTKVRVPSSSPRISTP